MKRRSLKPWKPKQKGAQPPPKEAIREDLKGRIEPNITANRPVWKPRKTSVKESKEIACNRGQ